uniref:Homeobox domain-containing protein n=1 Tax=Tetraodon nigroviridis TaxID=99883 RepID=H3C7Q3_TETNG
MEALLSGWLLREDFWLPPGTRWRDLRAREHLPLPDLLYTLPLALAFMALRYVFERFVLRSSSSLLNGGVIEAGPHRDRSTQLIGLSRHLCRFYHRTFVPWNKQAGRVPLSKRLGVRDKVRVGAPPIPQLEDFYLQRSRQPSQGEVVSLGKQCGLSQRKIQTWFRRRRNQDRPSNTRKFCEAS